MGRFQSLMTGSFWPLSARHEGSQRPQLLLLLRVLRLGLRLAWQVKRRLGYRSAVQAVEGLRTCACQP